MISFRRLVKIILSIPITLTATSGAIALETAPLSIGMSANSQPCTFYDNGRWQGSSFDIWQEVSAQAKLPFDIVKFPSFRKLLVAAQTSKVDVAVGCINMNAERLAQYRFSVPIAADSISVAVRKNPISAWSAVRNTLVELLGLLAGFLSVMLLLSILIWYSEEYKFKQASLQTGKLNAFVKLFQIMLTGPGTNTLAEKKTPNLLIGVAYFVRLVAASILVSFVTANIIRGSLVSSNSEIDSLRSLANKTVALRAGTVSDRLIQQYNAAYRDQAPGRSGILVNYKENMEQAFTALEQKQVAAVVADTAQIRYFISQVNPQGPFQIALTDLRPQSQGLIFSPRLSNQTALKINQAIATLRENGALQEIQTSWFGSAK
jgi:ABC-type amino acid transport substrate-binding protein